VQFSILPDQRLDRGILPGEQRQQGLQQAHLPAGLIAHTAGLTTRAGKAVLLRQAGGLPRHTQRRVDHLDLRLMRLRMVLQNFTDQRRHKRVVRAAQHQLIDMVFQHGKQSIQQNLARARPV